jgi:hypothetical protein
VHVNKAHAERVLFEQLKRTVPIEAVLARYGIELKRQGNSLKGRCPIHNGSNPRQFVVSNNLWQCFSPSCKRGGDIFNLVAELEKIDVKQAALLIAEWFAINPASPVQHRNEQRSKAMSEGSKPSHKVFVVEGEGDNAFWHRAGSAWPHKDGKGLNVQIPSGMSLSGRVVLREYTEEDAQEEQKSKRRK